MRECRRRAVGDLPDGLAFAGLDLDAVDRELDAAHRYDPYVRRKCFIDRRSAGWARAWPRPQIEASRMAADRLVEQRLVPAARRHQRDRLLGADPAGRALAAALVLEEAHQVDARPRGCRRWSDRMMTAAEPMKLPCASSVPKSRRQSPSDAGRMPLRRTARHVGLEGVAGQHAAADIRRSSSRTVTPAGAILTPGSTTRPDTE